MCIYCQSFKNTKGKSCYSFIDAFSVLYTSVPKDMSDGG